MTAAAAKITAENKGILFLLREFLEAYFILRTIIPEPRKRILGNKSDVLGCLCFSLMKQIHSK